MRQQNEDKASFPKRQTETESLTPLWMIMQSFCFLLLPLHHLLLLSLLLIKVGGTPRLFPQLRVPSFWINPGSRPSQSLSLSVPSFVHLPWPLHFSHPQPLSFPEPVIPQRVPSPRATKSGSACCISWYFSVKEGRSKWRLLLLWVFSRRRSDFILFYFFKGLQSKEEENKQERRGKSMPASSEVLGKRRGQERVEPMALQLIKPIIYKHCVSNSQNEMEAALRDILRLNFVASKRNEIEKFSICLKSQKKEHNGTRKSFKMK